MKPNVLVTIGILMALGSMAAGCSNMLSDPHAPQPTSTTSAPPTLLESADSNYKGHHWDDAIVEYQQAIEAGLPTGPATRHGTESYVKRRVSLCHEYKALAAEDVADYDTSATEFKAAIATDPTNKRAKLLLTQLQGKTQPGAGSGQTGDDNSSDDSLTGSNANTSDDDKQVRAAVARYLPTYIANYETVDGKGATLSDEHIEVSLSSSTEAVADMTYTSSNDAGQPGKTEDVRFDLRKYDEGWKVEDVDRS